MKNYNKPDIREFKENQNKAWADFKIEWLRKCKAIKRFEPEISFLRDKTVFHRQQKLRTERELWEIVDFFLRSEKSDEHLSITACFSADTINKWRMPKRPGSTKIGAVKN